MLKNRVKVGTSIDKEIYKEFQELAKETRIPISRLLDEALEDLIKKHKKK